MLGGHFTKNRPVTEEKITLFCFFLIFLNENIKDFFIFLTKVTSFCKLDHTILVSLRVELELYCGLK